MRENYASQTSTFIDVNIILQEFVMRAKQSKSAHIILKNRSPHVKKFTLLNATDRQKSKFHSHN